MEKIKHPIFAFDNVVFFPEVEDDILLEKEYNKKAFDYARESRIDPIILLVKGETFIPSVTDFYTVGVRLKVVNSLTEPSGESTLVSVKGVSLFSVNHIEDKGGFFVCEGKEIDVKDGYDIFKAVEYVNDIKSLMNKNTLAIRKLIILKHLEKAMRRVNHPVAFVNNLIYALKLPLEEKQELLETFNTEFKLKRVYEFLKDRVDKYRYEIEIEKKVKKNVEESQKRFFLNEKLKAIKEELGYTGENDLEKLKEQIEKAGMSKEAYTKAMEELKRLETMNPASAEASVSRTYIQWLIDVPWKKKTRDNLDIQRARKVLDRDHYGLTDVKERIIEFLAVRKLNKTKRNPIICFVGPPGVGKTSLARAIAESIGRKFVRMSLGGVRDEAEIRGHRRTYIGAIPGRLIYLMKKAGTINPLMLLDEIDKLSSDFRGDPSSALLEALDPEQNSHFVDHYLDVDYDLSRVFFILTANILDTIPAPLRDRFEIIRIPGYTFNEKMEIAKRHLIPKKLAETGLKKFEPEIKDSALEVVIERYTREAGVRTLERTIEKLFRKCAVDIVEKDRFKKGFLITEDLVYEKLGVPIYKSSVAEEAPQVGVATGLAWTPAGGDVLFIEVMTMPGSERIDITGQLGDVMKESIKAAFSYIKANYKKFGINIEKIRNTDIHVHIPEGAIPKDGPSAGITVTAAIFSALTKREVPNTIAMTGEITLRGRVLPVGGIKEKLLAAHRAGIYEVILPYENEKDLAEIPEEIKNVMAFHLVKNMDEVIDILFNQQKIKEENILPSESSGEKDLRDYK
ncbi:ATP-dependent Lon protease [Thermotomaculum hydrothermale]|uniref:Lon protease n=1 Tax=Thermotomaculum hydrothermale TaxID=981385 RepID=A0A7R6PMQ5_9BACT|nr:endopeptidase La [Thermotomaculum hydrothermale]BBB31941.1 ATP-dependent Lon protease [Thermotomaculum hydrothermale]